MILRALINTISDQKTKTKQTISAVFATLHSILFAAIPGLSIWVLYLLIQDPQDSRAFWIALLTIVLTLLRVPVLGYQLSSSYGIAFELGEKLRSRIIEQLQKLSLGTVRSRKSGRLIGLFNDDVKWIEAFIGGGLGVAIGALTIPFLLLIGLYFISSKLALILTAGILIGLPIVYFYNRIMRASVQERSANIADLSSRIGEHFAGMNVLRSFTAVGLKDKYFRQDLDKLVAAYKKSAWRMTPLSVLGMFLMEVAIVFVAYFGFQDITAGNIPSYVVISVLFIALSLYNPLLLFLAGSGQHRLAETSANNINDFFDLPEQKTETTATSPQHNDNNGLSFNNVSFGYQKDKPAVSNISFTAEPGKITAIVGPSGAGKSTLFNLAARFWDPDSGEITLGNDNLSGMKTSDLAKKVAIVTQDTVLINDSLKRNIDLGLPGYSEEQVKEAAYLARCSDFIEADPNGLEAQIGEEGIRLSGGEKQRLTLARALLRDAPVILLDEATSSVDPLNAGMIHASIGTLIDNKTVIVIAHKLSSIIDADKIIVMDKGRIAAEGSHDLLLEHCDIYQQLWHDSQSIARWTLGK